MKIKVGSTWLEPTVEAPIMVVMTAKERHDIANMAPDASMYAVFNDQSNMSANDRLVWMTAPEPTPITPCNLGHPIPIHQADTPGVDEPPRKTWNELFPERKGVVLQDGHIDPITGPRCMVKMSEGPHLGRYIIAHTETVLAEGTDVLVNDRQGKTMAFPVEQPAQSRNDVIEECAGVEGQERFDTLQGVVMSCKEITPGRTLHELTQTFSAAKAEAKPGDEYAGNPSKWPDVRGIKAVAVSVKQGFADALVALKDGGRTNG